MTDTPLREQARALLTTYYGGLATAQILDKLQPLFDQMAREREDAQRTIDGGLVVYIRAVTAERDDLRAKLEALDTGTTRGV